MLTRHHSLHRRHRTQATCRISRILVPFNFSARSKNALHYAAALGHDIGAELVLLHVVEPLVYEADYGYGCVTRRDPNQKFLKTGLARLNAMAKRLAAT